MRNECIELTGEIDPEEEAILDGSIDCPACGKTWLIIRGGDGWVDDDTTCVHLRFAIEPEATQPDEIHYFNGMTAERLVRAVAAAYRQANPEGEEMDPEESFGEALFDDQFWTDAAMAEVDSRFDFTQSGIACGPVSQTVLFGAKLNG